MKEYKTKRREYDEDELKAVDLAKAVKLGLPLLCAEKVLKDNPLNYIQEAFYEELGNGYTTISILRNTKTKLRDLMYPKETWDSFFDRIIKVCGENENMEV